MYKNKSMSWYFFSFDTKRTSSNKNTIKNEGVFSCGDLMHKNIFWRAVQLFVSQSRFSTGTLISVERIFEYFQTITQGTIWGDTLLQSGGCI